MAFVCRKYRCDFGHEWSAVVPKGYAIPAECPECEAIVAEAQRPAHIPDPDGRSDTQGAPGIRGDRTKAIARFEQHAFVRPHFDDGAPLLTNLRDDTRPGEIAAMPVAPSNNDTMRMVRDQMEAAQANPQRTTEGAAQMAASGGAFGWGGINPAHMAGGNIARPVVDLQSRRKP